MSKAKPRKPSNPEESKTAEAITVAWMLTVIATLLAEAIGLIGWAGIRWEGAEEIPRGILVLPVVMWITAVVTGVLNLILGAIVHRIRRVPAPKPIVIAAAIIGLLPVLGIFLLAK